ncbi:MAG: extracellular solute-binding protein family 1 [Paenibacillaceae bacterium]|jgi:putative aldouronate transport system substrate-binding protein|nr:extracellular solute-binding protein family 1 [Paenibacillaceae bacterium]
MNVKWRSRTPYLLLSAGVAVTLLSGCGGNEPSADSGGSSNAPESKPAETPYIELWRNLDTPLAAEKDGPYSKMLIKDTGVGLYMPYVTWNGGSAYVQKLNTRIASGELPDLFMPWQGNEASLIKQDALADLTDLLPQYAPNVWKRIPEEVWNVVRTADSSGKGRIYYVPAVQTYTHYGAFIRKDWLDRVGMGVPKTKDEYVEVLKAFRDKDANGNGDPNDELPVSGREQGRWMDHLFAMYGVAMLEGMPMWDIYDGKLTYSAITPNMKSALEFIQYLYKEKLLDNETFLNKADVFQSKVYNDKIGSWFHLNTGASQRIENIAKVNKDVHLVALGVPQVDGFKGFITNTQINRPQWVIANKNEKTTINALKLLDWSANLDNLDKVLLGVEGMHYEIKDGVPSVLTGDPDKKETRMLASYITGMDEINRQSQLQITGAAADKKFIYEQRDKIVETNQPFGKNIAGDGMPASIFDGYSDLKNQSMYQEYMTKIIIGEWPLSKFDEFVDKWNKSGGTEVTKRAQEWYQQMKK